MMVDSSVRSTRKKVSAAVLMLCIICQKKRKYFKRSEELLSQWETFQASETLFSAACLRKDERILLAIKGQDLIAIDIQYRPSCYANFPQPKHTGQATCDFNQEVDGIIEAVFKKWLEEV